LGGSSWFSVFCIWENKVSFEWCMLLGQSTFKHRRRHNLHILK
jgi:hypothetical protein